MAVPPSGGMTVARSPSWTVVVRLLSSPYFSEIWATGRPAPSNCDSTADGTFESSPATRVADGAPVAW
ncbi:hypothetical protein [Streptomyces anulatus]|uniref:hypothetical protein n=1 Tax=Streptomyces anulatus TaxID=1892 RepID=UPI0020B7199E|nr:hypothetical protein [Streptomyces anulatus]